MGQNLLRTDISIVTFEQLQNFPQPTMAMARKAATRREWQVKMHDTNDEAAAAVSQSSAAMATQRVVHAVCFIRDRL